MSARLFMMSAVMGNALMKGDLTVVIATWATLQT